jgi:hypothetical protein
MSNAPSRGESPGASADDVIRARAEECQQIVDKAILESSSGLVFLERLKDAGATPDEARDYIQQLLIGEGTKKLLGQPMQPSQEEVGLMHTPTQTLQTWSTLPL